MLIQYYKRIITSYKGLCFQTKSLKDIKETLNLLIMNTPARFMQQETLVCNNEFMKTRTILNDPEDNILQSKNNTKGLKILKIVFGRMTIDLDRHIISGTLL